MYGYRIRQILFMCRNICRKPIAVTVTIMKKASSNGQETSVCQHGLLSVRFFMHIRHLIRDIKAVHP